MENFWEKTVAGAVVLLAAALGFAWWVLAPVAWGGNGLTAGTLVKGSTAAVYYYNSDGKRYVFPDAATYQSWYDDFHSVQTVSDSQLAAMPVGGLVTYRPGTKLVKITTDPKVYAVTKGGILRWLTSETVAAALYGNDWSREVVDVPDTFFVSYNIGAPINAAADYDRQAERNGTPDISALITSKRQVPTDAATSSSSSASTGSASSGTTTASASSTSPAVTASAPAASGAAISGPRIYVAVSGSDDDGDGSEGKPFRTVGHALEEAAAGTAVLLMPGTYNEEVRVREPRVTLASATATRAVIKAPLPAGDSTPIAVELDVDADGSVVRDLEIAGGFYAVSVETRWDWGDPADRTGASDILIENNVIHGTGHDAVKIKPNADRVTVRDNEIYQTGLSQSPDDCNAEGIDDVNGDDLLVQGNYIHDICSNGVYCKGGATNCRIIGNRIENVGSGGIMVGFDTSPEYFDLTVNPGYYENIGGTVRDNLILHAGGAGIGLYASKDAVIENNTVVESSWLYHAPLYFGVSFQDWESYAGRPGNLNPTIRNNVFYEPATRGSLMAAIRYADELGGLSALNGPMTASGNCYFWAGGAPTFEDHRPGQEYDGGLAGWATHMAETGSVVADPGFDGLDRATAAACVGKGWRP